MATSYPMSLFQMPDDILISILQKNSRMKNTEDSWYILKEQVWLIKM